MSNVRISELPAASSVSGADELAVVQGGVTKRATVSSLNPLPTFIFDNWNGSGSSTASPGFNNFDLSDRAVDLGSPLPFPYYNLPSGWVVRAGNTTMEIPDGLYSVYFQWDQNQPTIPLQVFGRLGYLGPSEITQMDYYGTINTSHGGAGDSYIGGSCSFIDRAYSSDGDPATFSLLVNNRSIDTSVLYFTRLVITRLGD